MDVNDKENYDFVALHQEAEKGHMNVCQILINNGANVEENVDNGDTALALAAYKWHANICKILLDNSANFNTGGC